MESCEFPSDSAVPNRLNLTFYFNALLLSAYKQLTHIVYSQIHRLSIIFSKFIAREVLAQLGVELRIRVPRRPQLQLIRFWILRKKETTLAFGAGGDEV